MSRRVTETTSPVNLKLTLMGRCPRLLTHALSGRRSAWAGGADFVLFEVYGSFPPDLGTRRPVKDVMLGRETGPQRGQA